MVNEDDDPDQWGTAERKKTSPTVNILGLDVDLKLLGIHLALTPPTVYAFQQLGFTAWRGVFVVLVVYLVMLLRIHVLASDVS